MENRYAFLWLLLLIPFVGAAQSINIQESDYSGLRCAGSVVSIAFTTSGTFAAGNTFRVQLSANYGTTFMDIPGSFTSSPASLTLPAAASPTATHVYRLVADKPLIVSSYGNPFRLANVPSARLIGSNTGSIPINPYTPTNLIIALSGSGSYTVTMQDSTRFTKDGEYANSNDFLVSPARTTTYRLAGVRNVCGAGPVSGSATVAVNPVGFQLLNRANDEFCLGTQVPIYFSTDGPLPANTVFEAELISLYDGNRSVSVPVSGSASPLLVTLPKQLLGTATYGYQLRVYARAAGLSAWYRGGNLFSLASSPRLSLTATPSSVLPGEQSSLTLSYTTTTSGDVFLSNGMQVNIYSGQSAQFMDVSPVATTSYSVAAYTGACAEGISYGSRMATVRVRAGMRIDSLSSNTVCVGQPITIYYTATPGYTLPGRLKVQFNYGFSAEVTVAKPGQLVFTPPTSFSPLLRQAIRLTDTLLDTLVALSAQTITIITRPVFTFSRPATTVARPGRYYVDVSLLGGGTFEVLLNTGERLTLSEQYVRSYYQGGYNQMSLPLYVSGTTTFSTVSVSNECGVGVNYNTTTVTVENAPPLPTGIDIHADILSRSCPGSRQWLNVFPTGTFGAGNQFQLEVSGPGGTFFSGSPVQSFTKAEGGAMSFLLPTQPGGYRVRVSSTNPVTRSSEVTYSVNAPPTASVAVFVFGSSNPVGSLTAVAGQIILAQYNFANGQSPYRYEVVNWPKGQSNYGFEATHQATVTTNYGLMRVTDACGVTATVTSESATVTVVPSLLRTGTISAGRVCVQTPLPVPFAQFGTLPASVSYVVQFSENGTAWETAPTSGTVSPLTVTIPISLANKQVYYRVAYMANNELVPGIRYPDRVPVGTVPNTLLTTPANVTAVQIDRGNAYDVELKLIDLSSESTVVVANGTTILRLSAPTTGRTFYISQPGTYSIVSAVNECGFGQGRGTVRATLKPYLSLAKISRPTACVGQAVSFSYAAAGDFEPGNKLSVYLVDNYGNTPGKLLLTETTALDGVVSFSVSPALKASSYSVRVESSAPVATYYGAQLLVDVPVSATLASGSRVVYEGDTQELLISTNTTGGFSMTIATPTGLSAINSQYSSYYYLPVRFTQSGSYSLVSAVNQCGVGGVSGVLSVTALPNAGVTIRPYPGSSVYCTGKQYLIYLTVTGVFSTTNAYTASLADSTGNVRTLPTVSGPAQLTVTIPADMPVGNRYVVRVGSSSPQHLGATMNQAVAVRSSPAGTLTGNASIIKGDSARISVALTGSPPWQFVLTDFFGPRTFTTAQSPYTLTVRPDTTSGYRLTEVRDSQCGSGTATGTALITVSRLLATEPALPLQVRTWPNPTAGDLLIEGDVPGRGDVRLVLHNASGTLVTETAGTVRQGHLSHRLSLSQLPAGVYLLSAEQDGRRSQFKVLKR